MKFKKLFTGIITGVFATAMALSVSAEDYEIPFNTAFGGKIVNTYAGIVYGEDNGQWLAGGDNGDIGVTIDMLKEYAYIEIAYTCDNPIDGIMIGPAFKVHIKDRLDDSGNVVFYDYLPATWVGYGPQGDLGKGMTVNSLETIQQQQIEAEGVIKVSISKLLSLFQPDSDYLMGIGVGANNGLADDEYEDEEYILTATSVKLTGVAGEDAAETEAETTAPETTVTVEETTVAETTVTEAETTPAETTVTEAETTPAVTTSDTSVQSETSSTPVDNNGNNSTMIIIIIVAVVVVGGAAAFIFIKKKK